MHLPRMDPKNGTKNVVYDNHRYNAFVRSILLNSVSNDTANSFDIPKTTEMLKTVLNTLKLHSTSFNTA